MWEVTASHLEQTRPITWLCRAIFYINIFSFPSAPKYFPQKVTVRIKPVYIIVTAEGFCFCKFLSIFSLIRSPPFYVLPTQQFTFFLATSFETQYSQMETCNLRHVAKQVTDKPALLPLKLQNALNINVQFQEKNSSVRLCTIYTWLSTNTKQTFQMMGLRPYNFQAHLCHCLRESNATICSVG